MPDQRILLGVVGRPHGTRGLVRVHSYTAVPGDLARYAPLSDDEGRHYMLSWAGEGIAELAEQVDGVARRPADRSAAERLTNRRLYAPRTRLPPPENGEFYLTDLVGLEAYGPDGRLGRIAAVHDYGAGASIEIAAGDRPPLLVPFTRACVPEVDIEGGRVSVVPPAEIVTAREAVP